MKTANLLGLIIVAGIAAAIGYFVGAGMPGMTEKEAPKAAAMDSAKDTAADKGKVVATIDGSSIYDADVERMYENLPAQYKQAPLAMIKAQLVEQMVSMKIIQNAAKAEGFDKQSEFTGRMGDIQDQLLQEYYLEKKVQAAVTDATVKADYDKFVADFKPEKEVKARHILLKEEGQAKDLIVKLDEGGDFVELAKEHSTGPSGPRGGDLGYFIKERMVPAFAEAAFAMEKGAYSKEPVKTQFGWHIILVEDVRDTQPPSLDDKRQEISDRLSNETVTKMIDDLRAKAKVEIVEAAPAAEGADKAEDAKK